MPNKCTGCGRIYDNYAVELVKGCECGSNIFIFQRVMTPVAQPRIAIPKGAAPGPAAFEVDPRVIAQKVQTAYEQLKQGEAAEEESVPVQSENVEFDMESIRVIEDGVYDINIAKLANKEPLIVEIKDGKYFVHLASIFKKVMVIEDESLDLKKK